MPFKLGRVDDEILILQKDLQYFIDGLVAYGSRESSLATRIRAQDRPRLFGMVIPGSFPRMTTRSAWMTTESKGNDTSEVIWAETPRTGITFDGMVVECWVSILSSQRMIGVVPELHLIRPNECKGVETLKTLIHLAKDVLAS